MRTTFFLLPSEEENHSLFLVYSELNDALDIIIDSYEEEYIDAEKAKKALPIIERAQKTEQRHAA